LAARDAPQRYRAQTFPTTLRVSSTDEPLNVESAQVA
jgi:hypothetical protein